MRNWKEEDRYYFCEGNHTRLYEHLGAHIVEEGTFIGADFAVWAPNAHTVAVIGEFNDWDSQSNRMTRDYDTGIWHTSIPGVQSGDHYKYLIYSDYTHEELVKADPFAFWSEMRPKSASRIFQSTYTWNDSDYMQSRADVREKPMSIYEMHLMSWNRKYKDYRELARSLADYLKKHKYTHVELMPVMEHPFDGSWGYQCIGYYAPTSRLGNPDDFRYLVDILHQAGIGVILDWVPSHFATDGHGLAKFDGTSLYEHADPRQGYHPDWGSYIFNYGRNEVRNFLLSNAVYWINEFHIDGLRVDAVASMLYLDYSREDGQWVANQYGGNENLEAISFLRKLNETIHRDFPDVITIAEESTAWPGVTARDGLNFDFKWDMGWMHDTLEYFKQDPVHRAYHHGQITFRAIYMGSEKYVLPLSHDEVVHGKKSLIEKMPGTNEDRFASLRQLFAYQYAQPGKKMNFMGNELGMRPEFNEAAEIPWDLLDAEAHADILKLVADLNQIYQESALGNDDPSSFEWIDQQDHSQSIISFLRKSDSQTILCIFNFTPVPRADYRIGLPLAGQYTLILNSASENYDPFARHDHYNRSVLASEIVQSEQWSVHGRHDSGNFQLPGLSALFYSIDRAT